MRLRWDRNATVSEEEGSSRTCRVSCGGAEASRDGEVGRCGESHARSCPSAPWCEIPSVTYEFLSLPPITIYRYRKATAAPTVRFGRPSARTSVSIACSSGGSRVLTYPSPDTFAASAHGRVGISHSNSAPMSGTSKATLSSERGDSTPKHRRLTLVAIAV